MSDQNHTHIAILGSGSAGLTAAIYAARANLDPVVFHGTQPGGQLTITTDVENYPGFEDGIMGPELMDVMTRQAERFGTKLIQSEVTDVDFSSNPKKLILGDGTEWTADSVVIATGARAKLLGLESEDRLMGYGVSACATCDGFFFADKEVIVVGGGDSAMEEATFLAKFASKVTIVHRRDEFRASAIMEERAMKNEKVEVAWNKQVVDVLGTQEEGVHGVILEDTQTGERSEFPCEGMFLAIGHLPNTEPFEGVLDMKDSGYLIVEPGRTFTNVEGIFAAGDVADDRYRQAVTAAGTGCMAALDAERYLTEAGIID
jgi:thioredoxin reductase (NADPH)